MESFMLLWESIACFSTFHTLVILDILCFLLHWEVWMNWHITVFSKDHTKWNGTKRICHFFHVISLLRVIMLPLAAVLMDTIGMPWLFIGQGLFSICAALIENTIQLTEETRVCEKTFSFQVWKEDLQEVLRYFKKERGLQAIYYYMAATNGVASGYAPILVAFFRTAPGMSAALYSLFSIAEFLGRTIGGVVQYRIEIPKRKNSTLTFAVYTFYECMDLILLWLPYPLMLVNRAFAGFLGTNSATLRVAPSSLTFRNPCAQNQCI